MRAIQYQVTLTTQRQMSAHACNAKEILRAQRNGNDKIYIARLLQQNGGIFKISIVLFVSICEPGDELKPKQIRLSFSEKFPSKLLRYVSHSTKNYCGNRY